MIHKKVLKLSWFFVFFCISYFPTFGMISESTQTLPTQRTGLYDLSQDFANVIKTPPQEFIDLKIEIGFLNYEASGIYKLMPYYQKILSNGSGALPHIIQKNPFNGTWEMKKIHDSKNQEIIHYFPKEAENPLRDAIVVNVFDTLKTEAKKMGKESENLRKEVKLKNVNLESFKKEIESLKTLNAENEEKNRKEFENKLLEKDNQIKDINSKFQKQYKNFKFEHNRTFEVKQKLIEQKHAVEKKELKKKHENEIQIIQEPLEQKLLEKENEISNSQIQLTKFQKLNENLEKENGGLKYKETIWEEKIHSCHALYNKLDNEFTKLKKKMKTKVNPISLMKTKPTEVFYDSISDSLTNSESIVIKQFEQKLLEKDNHIYNLQKEILTCSKNNSCEYSKMHALHVEVEKIWEEENKILRKSEHILKNEIKTLKEMQVKILNEKHFEHDSNIFTNIESIVKKKDQLKFLKEENKLKFEHNLQEKITISKEFLSKAIPTNWNENKFETTELDSHILTNSKSIVENEYQLKILEKENQLKNILKNELIKFHQQHTFEYEKLHTDHLKLENDLQEENETLKKCAKTLKKTIQNLNEEKEKVQKTELKLDMKKQFFSILCEKENQIINLQKSNKDLMSDYAELKSKEENLRNMQSISSNDKNGFTNMIIELQKIHEQENQIETLKSQLTGFQQLTKNVESENVKLKSNEKNLTNTENISSTDSVAKGYKNVIIEMKNLHEKENQIKDLQSQFAEYQKLYNNLFSEHVEFKAKNDNLTNADIIPSNDIEKAYNNLIISELKIKHLQSQLTECQTLEPEKVKLKSKENNLTNTQDCSSSNVEKNMIIEELERKLLTKETKISTLELGFTTLVDIHKKVETQLRTENEKFKKNLSSHKVENIDEEIINLQNQIYYSQIELIEVKKLNENLKSENNNLMKSGEKKVELKEKKINEEFFTEEIFIQRLVDHVIAHNEYHYKELVSYFIKQLDKLDGHTYAELQVEMKSFLNLNNTPMLDLDDQYASFFVNHGVILYVEEQTHSIEKLNFLEAINYKFENDGEETIIKNWWISIGKPIYLDVLTMVDKKHKKIRDNALQTFENSKLKAKCGLFMKHDRLFLEPKYEYENVLKDVGYIIHGVRQACIEFKNSIYNYYSTIPQQTNKNY